MTFRHDEVASSRENAAASSALDRPDGGLPLLPVERTPAREDLRLAACNLHVLGSTIGAGWDYRDPGRAPGELTLSAIISAAALDPQRSIRAYRDEAREAARSNVTFDPFTARRLLARSRRYQLAASLIEEFCGGCAAACANAPYPSDRVAGERRTEPRRRADSRLGGRRLDDHLVRGGALPA